MLKKISKVLEVVKDNIEDIKDILDAGITIVSKIEKIADKSSK
jgi:hypothetical protein